MTVGNPIFMRRYVFDTITHELVGAGQVTDTLAYPCGGSTVTGLNAGTFPPSDCPVSTSVSGCDLDGASCRCTAFNLGSADSRGELPLSCFCEGGGDCPSYDEQLARCKTTNASSAFEEYAGCNLVAIRFWIEGSNYNAYFYDATTHALVGFEDGLPTSASRACGADWVHKVIAGTAPGPTCALTRKVDHCASTNGCGGSE
jgi:hypothetical protein